METISLVRFRNHFQVFQTWLTCKWFILYNVLWQNPCLVFIEEQMPAALKIDFCCEAICLTFIQVCFTWHLTILFCSQLSSNNLSGQIPEQLFQISKYKYHLSLSLSPLPSLSPSYLLTYLLIHLYNYLHMEMCVHVCTYLWTSKRVWMNTSSAHLSHWHQICLSCFLQFYREPPKLWHQYCPPLWIRQWRYMHLTFSLLL